MSWKLCYPINKARADNEKETEKRLLQTIFHYKNTEMIVAGKQFLY